MAPRDEVAAGEVAEKPGAADHYHAHGLEQLVPVTLRSSIVTEEFTALALLSRT
jgi:hypothetical protein